MAQHHVTPSIKRWPKQCPQPVGLQEISLWKPWYAYWFIFCLEGKPLVLLAIYRFSINCDVHFTKCHYWRDIKYISTLQCTTSHSNTDVGDNCKVQMWSFPLPSLQTRLGTAQTMTCLGPWKIRWGAGTVGMVRLFRKSCVHFCGMLNWTWTTALH